MDELQKRKDILKSLKDKQAAKQKNKQTADQIVQELSNQEDTHQYISRREDQQQLESKQVTEKKIRGNCLEIERQVVEFSIQPIEKFLFDKDQQCDLIFEQQAYNLYHGSAQDADQSDIYVPVAIESQNDDQIQNPHQVSQQIAASAKHVLRQHALPDKTQLTGEDISHIVKSANFQDFFNRSSRLVEKALINTNESNIQALIDVIGEQSENITGPQPYLQHSMKLTDQQYSSNRVITGIDWSPHRSDVLLASYSQNENGNINDPAGLVSLWSLSLNTRPEFYLFSQSQVTSVKYFPYQENLVLGGLYNGQIVLWDLRAKATPVQRTTFTTGHSYPIYSLEVVGSVNSHNIISISNDGKLCSWNMNMLNQPSKIIDQLSYTPPEKTRKDINVTCMQFPQGDANNFYIGSEDGSFYRAQLHSKQQNNQNVVSSINAHDAPISSLSISDNSSHHQLSGMVLTSSFDWTVKLWNPKLSGQPKQILTFDCAEDYIYDVAWNPVNPSVFCSADGEGYLDIWDLCEDIENPVYHEQKEKHALNKCRWSLDGSKIVTGDSVGNLNVYNMERKHLKMNESRINSLVQLYEGKL